MLECIPVIPPDLRPLVLLDSGNFATRDLNDLYRRIINRNNRLKKLVDLNAPEVIIRNEKRMLQQSVDALFDNNRCKRPVLGSSEPPAEVADRHDQGQAGPVPREPARQARGLLRPVGHRRRPGTEAAPVRPAEEDRAGTVPAVHHPPAEGTRARRHDQVGQEDARAQGRQVWDILEEVTKNHPVLLNRAPTLHRMGIQAFEPVLIEGNAIRIHPLVCKGFNADFDGDQMAVHLPLSIEAQVEATVLMMSTNNIFSPANGNPIITPSQDIVMGCYYLTAARGEEGETVEAGDGMVFHSPAELFRAHAEGKLGMHAKIHVRLPLEKKVITEVKDEKGTPRAEELPRKPNGLVRTTVGRVIFNDILHPKMAFYDLPLGSKYLSRIIADCYQILGRRETIALLDRMKETGFRESHPVAACRSPPATCARRRTRKRVLKEKDKEVEKVRKQFERGHHHRDGAVQQGDRPVERGPRQDHQADDDGPEERPPHGPGDGQGRAVPEPDLPDGPLRRPRRRRADPPARRACAA